jgi:hypothetical protein
VRHSITRCVYSQLLALYPPSFRREFGDEMASMFEECSSNQNSLALLSNVLLSVARQRIADLANSTRALFSPLAWPSVNVAQFSAATILCVELATALSIERPAFPQISTTRRSEVRVWSQTAGWGRYCSANPDGTDMAKSTGITRVLVAVRLAPSKSARIVRIACGHDRFVEPHIF